MASLVLPATREIKALWVIKARKDLKDLKATLARLVPRVVRVSKGPRGPVETLEKKVLWVLLEFPAFKETEEHLEGRVLWGPLVCLESAVPPEMKELPENLVSWESVGQTALKETMARMAL